MRKDPLHVRLVSMFSAKLDFSLKRAYFAVAFLFFLLIFGDVMFDPALQKVYTIQVFLISALVWLIAMVLFTILFVFVVWAWRKLFPPPEVEYPTDTDENR